MEELQDAIEDAQYMNAMNDDVPKPTKEWVWPTKEELNDYVEKLRTTSPRVFEAEGLCRSGSLGFYMFMRFCKDQGPAVKLMADFIEEVATYRGGFAYTSTSSMAKKIEADYLAQDSTGNTDDPPRKRNPNIVRNLPGYSTGSDTPRSYRSTRESAGVSKDAKKAHTHGSGSGTTTVTTPSATTAGTGPGAGAANGTTTGNVGSVSAPDVNSTVTPNHSNHNQTAPVASTANVSSGSGTGPALGIGTGAGANSGPGASNSNINEKPSTTASNATIQPKKTAPHWNTCIDLEHSKNAIKMKGEPIERVINLLKDVHAHGDGVVKGASRVPTDIFDELDEIVFCYLKDTYYEAFKNSPWWTRHFEFMCLTERSVVDEDFAIFRVLGRGGFGLVNACKRCTTGKLYAMKMLNKRRVKMKKAEALCLQERNIMAQISSPYVVCLKYAFTSKDDLYLILDLMTGGDLGFHLSKKGRFTVKESKYYAARTILGIAALHEKNIVYRDLKPENILMDEEGYTKISDLGLACKVGKSGLTGTCGTRGYWAPEMLRRDANDKRERYFTTVDWFSLGCLIYEFLYGICPFRTERARHWGDFPKIEKADRDKAIDLAIQQMDPEFDDSVFDGDSTDLIKKLLNKDPKQRLGAKGYKEIIAHPWFSSIDWDNISKSRPPSKPARDINTATQSEIGNFEDDKTSKKLVLSDEDQKTYEKWDFISKRSFQEEIVDFYICEEKYGPIKVINHGSGCCTIS